MSRRLSSVILWLSTTIVFAGCFSKTKVNVDTIVCSKLDDCPSGYVCSASKCVVIGSNSSDALAGDASSGTHSETGFSDARSDLGSGAGTGADGSGGSAGATGTKLDASSAGSSGEDGSAGSGGGDAGSGGTFVGDASVDKPIPEPDGGADAGPACTAPKVACNGDCIDPSTSCCVATDCKGTCMTCGSNHTCTAAKNEIDPSGHCSGTCDATGACKATQAQTCKAAGDCANGICADGYCCDGACTGSCQACDVIGHQGTCTTLAKGSTPHANHPACAGSDVCAGTCAGDSADCAYPSATSCGTASCSSSGVYQAAGACKNGSCSLPAAETCPNACSASSGCTGSCKPGVRSCSSTTQPQLCDSNGVNQPQTACNPGFTCTGQGECTCAAGKTNCTASCTDLSSDSENCGSCGHSCLGGVCSSSLCQPVAITSVLASDPQVFGVDSQYVYFQLISSSVSQAVDAYKVSKSAVGQAPTPIITSGAFNDFAGVIGSTIFEYANGAAGYATIGSSSFTTWPFSGYELAKWGSPTPRYYAAMSDDLSSGIFTINWYNASNNSLVATHTESATAGVPSGGYAAYGSPCAAGDSIYWLRTIYDNSSAIQDAGLFTASATATSAIQLAGGMTSGSLRIIDVNAKSVLLAGENASVYRVVLPASHSTNVPSFVSADLNSNEYAITEDANGVYFIDSAGSLYRCAPGNCSSAKVRLATDQPTRTLQYSGRNTLFQDDTALYWGRGASFSGTGVNQIMRLAK